MATPYEEMKEKLLANPGLRGTYETVAPRFQPADPAPPTAAEQSPVASLAAETAAALQPK